MALALAGWLGMPDLAQAAPRKDGVFVIGDIGTSGTHFYKVTVEGCRVTQGPERIDFFEPIGIRTPATFGLFSSGGWFRKSDAELRERVPWVLHTIAEKLGDVKPRAKLAYASGGVFWQRMKDKARLVTDMFNDAGFALAIPLQDSWKATFYGVAVGEQLGKTYRNVVAMGGSTAQLFIPGSLRTTDRTFSDAIGENIYYEQYVECLQQRDINARYMSPNTTTDIEPWRSCGRLELANLQEKLSMWPKNVEAIAVGTLLYRFPNGPNEESGAVVDLPTIKKQFEDGCAISPYDKFSCHSPMHTYAFMSAIGLSRLVAPPRGTDWSMGAALYAADCLRPGYN